jgi:hypothetical protein
MALIKGKQIEVVGMSGSFSGSFHGTASWAESASYATTASYVLNQGNILAFQIASGSVSASVGTSLESLFLVKSGNEIYFNISGSGSTTIYSNLFIIQNASTQTPVFSVSQSIVKFATQSVDPTGQTESGTIWFTSSSLYVGLEG